MVDRAAPRPDTTNASGVRTLVPAVAWRASSVPGATPPAHPPEPHSKPASRTPGLSVIPPFPAGICAVSHLPSPHSTGPGPPASKGASNGRRTGNPTWPSIGNSASDLRGESAEPGLQRGGTRAAMRVPVPQPGFGPSTPPPCTGTSLRRARGERRTNHRR
jgi:hypothetical protein